MKRVIDSPANIIRAAAAKVGAHSVRAISEITGIKNSTMQRRLQDISTATAGELSTLMHYFPDLKDEEVGRMIREVYK